MNYFPILSKLYKEGSWGGQCFAFLHKLVDFPSVGNLASAKIKSLNKFGIPLAKLDSIKVGDIVLQNTPIFDHGSFVNAIVDGKLQLTESNYNLDGQIHHTRLLRPTDKAILGVFRPLQGIGGLLFPTPVIYPIQLKVVILMNNQPFWNSLLKHMANLQNWFWVNSGQRIELIIDYKNTTLTNWPIIYTGPSIGGANVGIITPEWMAENVVGGQITIFNMPRKDWTGTVFDNPNLIEQGYAYENGKFPATIFTVADEFDDYPPYYSELGAYAKIMAHEIIHILQGVAAGPSVIPGGDYTHNFFYGLNGYPMQPEMILDDKYTDYIKLANF